MSTCYHKIKASHQVNRVIWYPWGGKKIQPDGDRTASIPMVDSKVKNKSKLNTVNRFVLVSATENCKNVEVTNVFRLALWLSMYQKTSRNVRKPIYYHLLAFFQETIEGSQVPQKHHAMPLSLVLTSELVPSCVFPYTSGHRKLMSIHKNV